MPDSDRLHEVIDRTPSTRLRVGDTAADFQARLLDETIGYAHYSERPDDRPDIMEVVNAVVRQDR